MLAIAINLGILALNLVVFGLSLKLYTEVLKDQSQNRRHAGASAPASGAGVL